jgi:4-amino-4-deoxy-L-arabinose transferase-like glycosyltransferase
VLIRIARGGVQNYGADGAEYIEHSARLAVVRHLRNTDWSSPWGSFVGADQSFPPLLHVLTGTLGEWTSHSAEVAASASVLWLLLLSLAVGVLASELTARRSVGFAAATGLLLLPAAHGFATRYYYDLPMTALLWCSAAAFLRYRQRAPLLGGGLAGLLLAAAALTKWPALAFGAPLILGAFLCAGSEGRPRWMERSLALGSATLVCCGAVASFLAGRGDKTSLARMARVGLDSGAPHTWTAQWDGPVGLALSRVSNRIGLFGLEDVTFYLLRSVTSIFSPLLACFVALLIIRWLARGRTGWRFVGTVLLGHACFLLGLVPLLDDRFLLPAAPALVVAATIGWSGLSPRLRQGLGTGILAAGLLVALDFHAAPQSPWNQPLILSPGDHDTVPCTLARGLGASGSVEHRGWSRADSSGRSLAAATRGCVSPRPQPRTAHRGRVWQAIQACAAPSLGIPVETHLFTPQGDKEWFTYRAILDELAPGGRATEVVGVCPTVGHAPFAGPLPSLVVAGSEAGLPGCLDPAAWELAETVDDPGGGPALLLFRRTGSSVCGP